MFSAEGHLHGKTIHRPADGFRAGNPRGALGARPQYRAGRSREAQRIQAHRYTTVLKIMQIMSAKGLVTRDETSQTHVYTAAAPEKQTQRLLLRDLTDRAFGGSARRLILGALSVKKISPDELAEIRALLNKLDSSEK